MRIRDADPFGVEAPLHLFEEVPVDIPIVLGPRPRAADEVDRGVRQGIHADGGRRILQRLGLFP